MKVILIVILHLLTAVCYSQTSGLEVTATGFQNDGDAYILLFTEGQEMKTNSKKCIHQKVKITGSQCSYSFPDLPNGKYAMIIFHDENQNGKLDTNLIGMPKEGVGNSNNHMGIPSFRKCHFQLNGKKTIDIRIQYLLQ